MTGLDFFKMSQVQKQTAEGNFRSSCPEVFSKKGVPKNYLKFTGKHLCQSLLCCRPQACNFIKKEILTQVFSCEFCEIFKNIFYRTPPAAASEIYQIVFQGPWSWNNNLNQTTNSEFS